jgi:hypothetical protein
MPPEKPVINITVDGVKDFSACARFYDYRHRQLEYEPLTAQKLMSERFHNTLVRVVSFFFYKKQSGVTPSYNALLNRWERLWFPKDYDPEDLFREQTNPVHGNIASYSNIAALGLMKLYEDFGDVDIIPMLINEKYIVPKGETADVSVRFQGVIDLAIRREHGYEVYTWSTEKRRPSQNSLAMELAATKMAFDYRSPRRLPTSYKVYDLGSSSPGHFDVDINDLPSDALEFWIKEIVSEQVFPSRRGLSSYCRGCPFDALCASWKGWQTVSLESV